MFFLTARGEYLGYTISGGTLSVSAKEVGAVLEWPVSKAKREIRSFVQLCFF
jgi:hypothetical protein